MSGFMSLPELVQESIFDIMRDGGEFTVDSVNIELDRLGFKKMVTDSILEEVVEILRVHFKYSTSTHTVH